MRFLFLTLTFFPLFSFGNDCLEVRAAISLHLNSARLVVAEVDKCKSTISKYFLEMDKSVDLISGIRKRDLGLTIKLQGQAIKSLKNLAQNAREFRPKNLLLIPSKSLKKLTNNLEFLKEIKTSLNCKIVLPNLETESILGFLAAKLKILKITGPLMSWTLNDSGSFWVVENDLGKFKTFHDKISPYIFKDMVIEGVLKKDHLKIISPNPLGLEKVAESEKLLDIYLKYNFENFLREKSKDHNVVGIGQIYTNLLEPNTRYLYLDQLKATLAKSATLTDKDIGGDNPELFITNIVLTIKMMENMGINEITPLSVNEADGALVYEDYWKTTQI